MTAIILRCKKDSLSWPVELAVAAGLLVQIVVVAGAVLVGISVLR